MIPAETIAELKASHADAWQQKRAAGLTEQQTAQVILSQIELDKTHPPEVEAARRIKQSRNHLHVQQQRFREALASHKRAMDEVAVQFPDGIDLEPFTLELESSDADLSGLNKLLEEHRELVARQNERIKELEAGCDLKVERILQLEDQVKALTQERDQALGDLDSLKGVNEMHRIKLEKTEADLKAAQAALKTLQQAEAKRRDDADSDDPRLVKRKAK